MFHSSQSRRRNVAATDLTQRRAYLCHRHFDHRPENIFQNDRILIISPVDINRIMLRALVTVTAIVVISVVNAGQCNLIYDLESSDSAGHRAFDVTRAEEKNEKSK